MTRWLASTALGAPSVRRAANAEGAVSKGAVSKGGIAKSGIAKSARPAGPRAPAAGWLVLGLAVLLGACGGGYPEPRNQLTASEAAVRAAEVAGAQNSPQSALHLKRAREQVEIGRNLIQEGENERAEWVLKRAESDADLALAVATEETRRKQAAAAKEELDHLRDSLHQNGATP